MRRGASASWGPSDRAGEERGREAPKAMMTSMRDDEGRRRGWGGDALMMLLYDAAYLMMT